MGVGVCVRVCVCVCVCVCQSEKALPDSSSGEMVMTSIELERKLMSSGSLFCQFGVYIWLALICHI